MKFTAILVLAACLQVSASGYSQKVTLSEKNAPMGKVFRSIKKQTGYAFFFDEAWMRRAGSVNIEVKEEPLEKVLDICFKDKPLTYSIVGNTIVVKLREQILKEKEPIVHAPVSIDIHGVVTDENNKGLQGVSVTIKGNEKGTTTDVNGNFAIELPDNGGVLVISYVGYEPIETKVSKSGTLNFVLKPKESSIEEVVVIGYGTAKRKDITGAISSIKATTIPKSANTSIDQALSGRAAGLMAIQSSGQPGASVNIQIRGNASFASEGVLYVVDGVPVNGGAYESESGTFYGGVSRSPLNFINPEDIESLEVLKDASSAAIYGARAGAGVILITTKKGKQGASKLNYAFSHAFQKPAEFYEILNQHDYMFERNRILKEKWLRDNKIAPYGAADPSTAPAFVPRYTQQEVDAAGAGINALDAVTQSGFVQQHNISVSGGTEKTKYYVSGNYLDQDGVVKTSSYKRYTGRVNLDQSVGNKIKLSVNINGSRAIGGNPAIGEQRYENAGIILAAFYHPPTVPLQAADGSYPINPDYLNTPNPLSYLTTTDNTVATRLLTAASAEWDIWQGLKAKANFSFDQSSNKRSTYLPKTLVLGARNGGIANIFENTSTISLLEYLLSYNKIFAQDHSVNAMAGYSYQVLGREGLNAGSSQFLTDGFQYNNLSLGAVDRPTVGSFKSREVWASYFGRVTYGFRDKYLLTGSLRRDGASKFAENKKYGWFPSVSAAWKISNEGLFMNAVPAVSFLKLRASYGTTGNSNIGGNAFSYYSPGANYIFGSTQNVGVYLSQLANPDLTWETAREVNLGLDFGLFRDRISGSFEVFNKVISDLLSSRPLPTPFIVGSVAANIGKTRSKGYEISLKTVNISKADFTWNTELNFAHFKDTWKERDSSVVKTLAKYVGINDPLRAIYGYVAEGILKPGDPVPAHMTGLMPGMVKVKDLNGYDANGNLTGKPDGKLNSADRIYLGTSDPGYTFGISNSFRYKNFDLNIFLYGMLDRTKYNDDKATAYGLQGTLAQFGWNALSIVKDRWASDNPNGSNPSGLNSPYDGFTENFFREKAGFLRCRNITLGYTLPQGLIKKQKVASALRVFADAQNLFVITPYSGMDPELSSFVAYPAQRSLILGLNVTF